MQGLVCLHRLGMRVVSSATVDKKFQDACAARVRDIKSLQKELILFNQRIKSCSSPEAFEAERTTVSNCAEIANIVEQLLKAVSDIPADNDAYQ